MKPNPRALATLVSAVLTSISLLGATGGIATASIIANIVMSTTTPEAGTPVVFDGSNSICDNPTGCSYTWQWFWRSADGTTTHLGGQMGRTPVVSYAFDGIAASKPYVIVTLTVGAGRLVQPSTASTSFVVRTATTGVEPPPAQSALRLAIDNSPDPFYTATTIHYNLPASGRVNVGVFDAAGRRVRALVARTEAAGAHLALWDGRTDKGERVKPGVYFARIETLSHFASDRLTVAK